MTSVDQPPAQPHQPTGEPTPTAPGAPSGSAAPSGVGQAPAAPGAVGRGEAGPTPAGADGAWPGGVGPGAGAPHGVGPGEWPQGYPGGYPVVESDRLSRFVARVHARTPRWVVPLAALGCVGAGIGYTLISDPTRSAPDALPSCLLKLTTGLDCPGCGGTRALWYVLHADLPAAARHHFLFVFALPFLAYFFIAWAGKQAFGWRLPELRVGPKAVGVFLAAWLAFSVARNLPWYPFTTLYV